MENGYLTQRVPSNKNWHDASISFTLFMRLLLVAKASATLQLWLNAVYI